MKSKIMIKIKDNELFIEGNKEGLKYLSKICEDLSNLSDEQAKTPANHFHLMSEMGQLDKDSLSAIVYLNPEL